MGKGDLHLNQNETFKKKFKNPHLRKTQRPEFFQRQFHHFLGFVSVIIFQSE